MEASKEELYLRVLLLNIFTILKALFNFLNRAFFFPSPYIGIFVYYIRKFTLKFKQSEQICYNILV